MKWLSKYKDKVIARQNWEIALELRVAETKIEQLLKEIEMWKERGSRINNAYDSKNKEHESWVELFLRHFSDLSKLHGFKEAVEKLTLDKRGVT